MVATLIDARDLASDRAIARTTIVHDGTVVDRHGDGSAEVRYTNQKTGQELEVTLHASNGDLIPDEGQSVTLEVARADPERVNLVGDGYPSAPEVWWFVVLPLVPAALIGARWASARRVSRAVPSRQPAFAMVGVLTPPWPLGHRATLQLYPLDARPGSRPACAVPLLDTRAIAFGLPFAVEVKGVPRPLGRLVASTAGEVLWPVGRALPSATAPMPAEPVGPIERPEPVTPPTIVRTAPIVAVLLPELVIAAATTALLVVVGVVTVAHARAAHRLESTGTEVIATVTHRGTSTVTVEFVLPGDEQPLTSLAPVDFPEDFTVDRRYPVVVDPDDPSRVRLVKERYDAVQPYPWAVIPFALSWLLVFRRFTAWRRSRRLAASPLTPWHRPAGWTTGDRVDRARIALGVRSGLPSCVAVLPDAPARRMSPVRDDLLVAGLPGPGHVIALFRGGELVPLGFRAAVPHARDLQVDVPPGGGDGLRPDHPDDNN